MKREDIPKTALTLIEYSYGKVLSMEDVIVLITSNVGEHSGIKDWDSLVDSIFEEASSQYRRKILKRDVLDKLFALVGEYYDKTKYTKK